MTNTLVIGGGGYIGAYLLPLLIASGRNVSVLGRSTYPRSPLPRGVNYVVGDFGQKDLVSSLLEYNHEIIHLAYATVPNTSFSNPLADLLENLPSAVHLFSEAALKGVKLVYVSSGGTVYGESVTLPIYENHSTRPISPYGVTKLTLENYAHLYSITHGLKFVCVRPANAYGAGQKPFTGQGFIATAISSILRGSPVQVFGQHGAIRDYIYISDLASGIVSALDKGIESETYNIGSGTGISNMDVIEKLIPIMRSIGHEVSVQHLPERLFDVKSNVLGSDRLREHTGWIPKIDFEAGLRLTLKSFLRLSA
jgi:UDP-glucose 4-epimerase